MNGNNQAALCYTFPEPHSRNQFCHPCVYCLWPTKRCLFCLFLITIIVKTACSSIKPSTVHSSLWLKTEKESIHPTADKLLQHLPVCSSAILTLKWRTSSKNSLLLKEWTVEGLRLVGTSEDHVVQPPSLGNLFQCTVTLTVKKCPQRSLPHLFYSH